MECFSQSYPDLDAQCGDISSMIDDETGETKFFSPFELPISFRKIMNNGNAVYYMRVSAVSNMKNVGKGVMVRFDRGYSIQRDIPTEMYEESPGVYVHYAEFKLSKDDVSKLKNYTINGYEVYMYSNGAENTMFYMAYMHCLSKR